MRRSPGFIPASTPSFRSLRGGWRGRLHELATWRDIGEFRLRLRDQRYDAAVDTQGLVRSALIAFMVRGVRHGYDRASVREGLACWFYDIRHTVRRAVHAIRRNRTLTGPCARLRGEWAG